MQHPPSISPPNSPAPQPTHIDPLHTTSTPRLTIRIPSTIWNSYHPQPQPQPHTQPRRPQRRPQQRPRSVRSSSIRPENARPCKIKITRFLPGGPSRAKAGKYKNVITIRQPCAEVTCSSCQEWNRHLFGEDEVEDVESIGRA
ncbi:hypothetical protein M011DRAFT_307186 [Sporormia fimetaria CBS 119925]|uniref:Uncharacterized protein n=1 Tax=Sporormia fimetaria CBS 119925 TaxID=1340428 RepID=A0A6A6VHW8_9PLEO|nr:hypothetical protein M011DRAFT_307186 [Sporormia fimetaria CBS 119925]